MTVSGFTLVRNGVEFEYPFLESIGSMLPLVDELIVNLGISQDETAQRIHELAKKETRIKVLESDWYPQGLRGEKLGLSLSEQTNFALSHCQGEWCLYLQADEVLHESDTAEIRTSLERADPESAIDGVLFNYVHFYGSYDVVHSSRSAYRREVRAFKNKRGVRSVGDAQSFRKGENQKLTVLPSRARVFHYGWVRSPEKMREKTYFMDQLYHGENSASFESGQLPATGQNYVYKRFWGLKRFEETHPHVMHARIASKNWKWDFENSPRVWSRKDIKKIVLDLIERLTNIRLFEYRSYKIYGR